MRLCQFCKKYTIPEIQLFKENKKTLQFTLQDIMSADPLANIIQRHQLQLSQPIYTFPPLVDLEYKHQLQIYLKALPKCQPMTPSNLDPLSSLKSSVEEWIESLSQKVSEKRFEENEGKQLMHRIANS